MINKAMFKQVQAFRRQGYSKGAIVTALEFDPRTVAKYFAMEEEDYRSIRIWYDPAQRGWIPINWPA